MSNNVERVYSGGLQKHLESEVRFLREVKESGGVTIIQALEMVPKIDFGTGIDGIDLITKFLNLGFIEYQSDINKFVAVKLE